MALVTSRALVLQTFRYSDTSKILRLYTREHGQRSAIAKGALRPKSRFGGLLEPFTEGNALLYLKENRDLQTLSGFDLVKSRQVLGRELTAFAGASLLAELLLRFTTEEPNPELFRLATESLDSLADSHRGWIETRVLFAAWAIISHLGYRPELEVCVGCGTVVHPEEAARFHLEEGGIACFRCRPTGRQVDAASRAELRSAAEGKPPLARVGRPGLQRSLLQAYLATHLGQHTPLRSLNMLIQQLSETDS